MNSWFLAVQELLLVFQLSYKVRKLAVDTPPFWTGKLARSDLSTLYATLQLIQMFICQQSPFVGILALSWVRLLGWWICWCYWKFHTVELLFWTGKLARSNPSTLYTALQLINVFIRQQSLFVGILVLSWVRLLGWWSCWWWWKVHALELLFELESWLEVIFLLFMHYTATNPCIYASTISVRWNLNVELSSFIGLIKLLMLVKSSCCKGWKYLRQKGLKI